MWPLFNGQHFAPPGKFAEIGPMTCNPGYLLYKMDPPNPVKYGIRVCQRVQYEPEKRRMQWTPFCDYCQLINNGKPVERNGK